MCDSTVCPICLDKATDGVNYCTDKEHELTCRQCINNLIESSLSTSHFGSCPAIYCPSPSHQVTKKRRLLNYEEWKSRVPEELSSKYNSLAASLLSFLCSSCHTPSRLDVGYDNPVTSIDFLTSYFTGKESVGTFQSDLLSYINGEVNIEDTYHKIISVYFPHLLSAEDKESWKIFSNILQIIPNPERRINLHLRYLHDRPKFYTPCCKTSHCFKCKTKGYHDGKSCEELTSSLTHNVVYCPSCGIALTKGDGCDTVHCACGHRFGWWTASLATEHCIKFLELFPENTSRHAAQLLCYHTENNTDLMNLTRAWHSRHRIDVNQYLVELFKKHFYPCPTQCCAALPTRTLSEGFRLAVQLLTIDLRVEVEKSKQQIDIARSSLFITLYPNADERPLAAHRLTTSRNNNNNNTVITPWEAEAIYTSAKTWIQRNRAIYDQAISNLEVTNARQFLLLYGNTLCSNPTMYHNKNHVTMLDAFKRQLRSLVVSDDYITKGIIINQSHPTPLKVDGTEWINLCASSIDAAQPDVAYNTIHNDIITVLNSSRNANNSLAQASITWNVVLKALSWCYENKESYAQSKLIEWAMSFYGTYLDDAPFMAAINLKQFHSHKVSNEEANASLAFMKVFPDICHEWYLYDATSSEPMIERVAPHCFCLPRHYETCPLSQTANSNNNNNSANNQTFDLNDSENDSENEDENHESDGEADDDNEINDDE